MEWVAKKTFKMELKKLGVDVDDKKKKKDKQKDKDKEKKDEEKKDEGKKSNDWSPIWPVANSE